MDTSNISENSTPEQPTNTPQVEEVGRDSSPKKLLSVPMVIVYVIMLIALVVGAYLLATRGMSTAQTTQKEDVLPGLPTTEPTSAAIPPLSTSDKTTDIEKDLNNTQIEDITNDFTAINSDIDAL